MNNFLTPRLMTIAALVREGAKIIDVGTDHAYVPIYLALENKICGALATDINEGPLQRADENIEKYGLANLVKTKRTNGLFGIDMEGYDTVIVAGMGGLLIADILQNAPRTEGISFILQPMTAIPELRKYLLGNAFKITEEHIVREDEKLYTVIVAERGEDVPYSEAEFLLGKYSKESPLYPEMVKKIKEKLLKKLSGMLSSKEKHETEIARIKKIIEEMEL